MQFKENVSFDYIFSRGDQEIILSVEATVSHSSGNYTDRPEDCFDDESEIDITSLINHLNEDWLDKVSEEEESDIRTLAFEEAMKQYNEYEEVYEDELFEDDYDYDAYF